MEPAVVLSCELNWPLSKMIVGQSSSPTRCPNLNHSAVSAVLCPLLGCIDVSLCGDLWHGGNHSSHCASEVLKCLSHAVSWASRLGHCLPLSFSSLQFLSSSQCSSFFISDLSLVQGVHFPPSLLHVAVLQCLDTKSWRGSFSVAHNSAISLKFQKCFMFKYHTKGMKIRKFRVNWRTWNISVKNNYTQ